MELAPATESTRVWAKLVGASAHEPVAVHMSGVGAAALRDYLIDEAARELGVSNPTDMSAVRMYFDNGTELSDMKMLQADDVIFFAFDGGEWEPADGPRRQRPPLDICGLLGPRAHTYQARVALLFIILVTTATLVGRRAVRAAGARTAEAAEPTRPPEPEPEPDPWPADMGARAMAQDPLAPPPRPPPPPPPPQQQQQQLPPPPLLRPSPPPPRSPPPAPSAADAPLCAVSPKRFAARLSSMADPYRWPPSAMIDGSHVSNAETRDRGLAVTQEEANAWASLRLPSSLQVGEVSVYNRGDDAEWAAKLGELEVWLGASEYGELGERCGSVVTDATIGPFKVACGEAMAPAGYVTVRQVGEPSPRHLILSEIAIASPCRPPPPPQPPRPPGPLVAPFPPSPPPGTEYEFFHGLVNYRLGDMFLYRNWRDNVEQGGPYHREHFPDSIIVRYMDATEEESNYAILGRVVDEVARERGPGGEDMHELPPADAVVLHLRVGDVLDLAGVTAETGDYHTLTAQEALDGSGSDMLLHYTYPLSYYEGIIPKLPQDVRTCYIVAGTQYTSDHGWPLSTAYVNGIRDLFVSEGFAVRVMAGFPPDDDVIFMAHAKHFIRGGGGYSGVVAGLVAQLGGTVHWDNHPGSGIW